MMAFFGAVFAVMNLMLPLDYRGMVLGVPLVVFAVIALAAAIVIRRPGAGISRSKQAVRVITWSSIGEGVGIVIAADLVVNLGHRDWLLPAIASVVGLHFLPMAHGIPFRPFYAIGLALLLAAAAGFAIRQPAGSEVAGFAAAAVLWAASLLAIWRDMKFKTAGASMQDAQKL